MLDEVQDRSQQEPSLAAALFDEPVRIDDLTDNDRWPEYREEALAQTEVRSIPSVPMVRESEAACTLNFYAETTHQFETD